MVHGRFILTFVAAWLVGCGAAEDDEALRFDSREAALSASCGAHDATTSLDASAMAGDYVRSGVTKRDEIRTLSVREPRATASRIEATYSRTIARKCTQLGCPAERGTMRISPSVSYGDEWSFEPSESAVGEGVKGAVKAADVYRLIGIEREGGRVAELCMARVVDGTVGPAFVLRRE